MKKINNITLFIFICLTLSNVVVNCFYYGRDPGANFLGNVGATTMVTGAATGNKNAVIAGGALMGVGAMQGAAAESRDRDRYYRDRDYYEDDYNRRSSRRSRRQERRDLEDENAELRQRLQQYESQ